MNLFLLKLSKLGIAFRTGFYNFTKQIIQWTEFIDEKLGIANES